MAAPPPEPAKPPWDARLVARMSRSSGTTRKTWSAQGLVFYGTGCAVLGAVEGFVGWFLIAALAYVMAFVRWRHLHRETE